MTRNSSISLQCPYPIFCRGHSDGRLLCEAFIRNGINMGHVTPDHKDTSFFSMNNPVIRKIVLFAYQYNHAPSSQRRYYQELMRQCIEDYWKSEIQTDGPFGWKMGLVMLARLDARIGVEQLSDPANRLMVFGDPHIDTFAGHSLTAETIRQYRNELEMQHWVTAVQYGLQGRAYPERYLEVRYEQICHAPLAEFQNIFLFLGVPFLDETKAWLKSTVRVDRIGKWTQLAQYDINNALHIGSALLNELGYL